MSSNKHVIVTGAARGIGRCIARTALEKGWKVFMLDIMEDELKHAATVHLKKYYDDKKCDYAVCDLRDPQAIRATIKKAAEFLGGTVDVLINNGGIASPQWSNNKTFKDEETLDEWQAYVDTNLTAPFVASQAVVPYMIKAVEADPELQKRGGAGPCIIHIGSFRSAQSDPNQEGYAATKAGQLGLMHSMAMSSSRWGIRCNLVAPGRIKATHECKEGDEKGETWEDVHEAKDEEDHATNRAGTPQDIAEACWYLADAGFVTAQEIFVDGGASRMK